MSETSRYAGSGPKNINLSVAAIGETNDIKIGGRFAKRLPKTAALAIGIALLYILPNFNAPLLGGSNISFPAMLFFPVGIYVLLALGLDVMVGRSGLSNLGYAGFFAAGAYTTGVLTTRFGFTFFEALLPAMVVALLLGVFMSMASLRTKGHYLAIITLGMGMIVYEVVGNVGTLGGIQGISGIPHPGAIFGVTFGVLDFAPYDALLLTAILLTVAALWVIGRGRVGRSWTAIRDDELAARLVGVKVERFKVTAFAVGGTIGGLAGALYATQVGFIDPSTFTLSLSIFVLAAVVLVGKGRIWSVVLGAVVVAYLPERFQVIGQWNTLVFGLVLALIMLLQPQGLSVAVRALVDRVAMRRSGPRSANDARVSPSGSAWMAEPNIGRRPQAAEITLASAKRAVTLGSNHPTPVLEVDDLVVAFGGLVVLNGLSLSVARGEVVSIIGPNGAGKSTILNVVTGIYKATSGDVRMNGASINDQSSDWRARQGISRTFQNIRLFHSMTALENVLVAAESKQSYGVLGSIFNPRRLAREKSIARDRAMGCLSMVGLANVGDVGASSLSYGAQRRLEIARALALDPALLLLDEPAAGSNPSEKLELSEVIKNLAAAGYSVILVEHNVELVVDVSDKVIVVNFGVKIAEGTGRAIQEDPVVQEAYLGVTHAP